MGIKVGHDVSAATLADAGFAIGQGEKNVRDQERADKLNMFERQMRQRDIDRNVQLYEMDRRLQQQDSQFATTRDDRNKIWETELGRRDREQEFAEQRFAIEQQNRMDMQKEAIEARLAGNLARHPEFIDNIAMRSKLNAQEKPQFTPSQQKRIEELQMMRMWVGDKVRTGEWTDQEAAQVLEQSEMALMNIQPKKNSDYDNGSPEQDFMNRLVVDPVSGKRFIRSSKGDYEPIENDNAIKFADYQELFKSAREMLTVTEIGKDGIEKATPPDDAVVAQYVKSVIQGYQSLTGGNPMTGEVVNPQSQKPKEGYDQYGYPLNLGGGVNSGGGTEQPEQQPQMPQQASPPPTEMQSVWAEVSSAMPNASVQEKAAAAEKRFLELHPEKAAQYTQQVKDTQKIAENLTENSPPDKTDNPLKKVLSMKNTAGRDMMNQFHHGKKDDNFTSDYKTWAKMNGINEDPDDPKHEYDYRGYYAKYGKFPTKKGEHLSAEFKAENHPTRFINGLDTAKEHTEKEILDAYGGDKDAAIKDGWVFKNKKENPLKAMLSMKNTAGRDMVREFHHGKK